MSMDNMCMLEGRLAADPRFTDNEEARHKRVRFPLAVQREGVDKNKNPDAKDVDYLPIVAWGNQAAAVAKYCMKGKKVKVQGELRQTIYEKNGETVYGFEIRATPFGIKFGDSPKKDQQPNQEDLVKAVLEKLQDKTEEPTTSTDDECPIP